MLDTQFFREDEHLLELLELGEIAIYLVHNFFVELLHVGVADQISVRREDKVVFNRPVAQHREGWCNDDGREAPTLADDGRFADQRICLQRAFNRLWSNKLPTGGLEQVFLAVRDDEKSVRI